MTIVRQSKMLSLPISKTIARMMATDATFTASKNADILGERRNAGMSGFRNATNKNDGRKIPIVAATAPQSPPTCQPIKVAAENTGPGVN